MHYSLQSPNLRLKAPLGCFRIEEEVRKEGNYRRDRSCRSKARNVGCLRQHFQALRLKGVIFDSFSYHLKFYLLLSFLLYNLRFFPFSLLSFISWSFCFPLFRPSISDAILCTFLAGGAGRFGWARFNGRC